MRQVGRYVCRQVGMQVCVPIAFSHDYFLLVLDSSIAPNGTDSPTKNAKFSTLLFSKEAGVQNLEKTQKKEKYKTNSTYLPTYVVARSVPKEFKK